MYLIYFDCALARSLRADHPFDSMCKFETDPLPLGPRFRSEDYKVLYRTLAKCFTGFLACQDEVMCYRHTLLVSWNLGYENCTS